MPYRIFGAAFQGKMPEEAHGYCAEAFGDFYSPPFAQSLSKGLAAKPLISFKLAVLRQAQHERFWRLIEVPFRLLLIRQLDAVISSEARNLLLGEICLCER
jgi:hypothetical protein